MFEKSRKCCKTKAVWNNPALEKSFPAFHDQYPISRVRRRKLATARANDGDGGTFLTGPRVEPLNGWRTRQRFEIYFQRPVFRNISDAQVLRGALRSRNITARSISSGLRCH